MDNKNLDMAIDFSGPFVDIAIWDNKTQSVLLSANKLMQRREASSITSFITDAMQAVNLNLAQVKNFTVGSGPGSFTGMRIAAAWVSGFTFGKDGINTRTIPSAFAIAKSANLKENESACIIFDGRNREVIVFGVSKVNGTFVANGLEEILNQEQCKEFFQSHSFDLHIAMEYDSNAIQMIVPETIFNSLKIIKTVEAINLLDENLGEFDNDLTKLHYIRPSVTTTNK